MDLDTRLQVTKALLGLCVLLALLAFNSERYRGLYLFLLFIAFLNMLGFAGILIQ